MNLVVCVYPVGRAFDTLTYRAKYIVVKKTYTKNKTSLFYYDVFFLVYLYFTTIYT